MGRAGCWPDRVHTPSSEVNCVGLDGIQGHVCSHQQLCHNAAVVPRVAESQLLIDSLDGSVGCRMQSDRSPGSGAGKHCSLSSSCPLPSMPPSLHVLPPVLRPAQASIIADGVWDHDEATSPSQFLSPSPTVVSGDTRGPQSPHCLGSSPHHTGRCSPRPRNAPSTCWCSSTVTGAWAQT